MHSHQGVLLAAITALSASVWITPLHTDAEQKPAMRPEPAVVLQQTHVPQWPFTPEPPPGSPKNPPDSGEPYHLPGSSKAYTQKEIDGETAVDWFPELHSKAPTPVVYGKPGLYRPCGICHLINGYGKSDIDSLNGKPVAYMRQQLDDMKRDLRHASVENGGLEHMILVAKGVPGADATEALEYFHSIGPAKWIRVVEADVVPKTIPAQHEMLAIDPSGATEPIGNRVIEVPENFERAQRRDPTIGYLAYVPVGSLAKGEALARTGANGRVMACITCHGADMRGINDTIPPIAGRSPSAIGRALYDFKTGARHGKNASMMKSVADALTDEDIVNLSAYLASMPQ